MVSPSTAAAFAEHMRQGAVARQRGDLTQATAAVQAALALVPGQPEALRWLGDLARARGDDTAAEAAWRQALAAAEAQPAVWNNLGNLLARTGRADEALAAFARAIALTPDYAEAHYNQARVLHRAGRGVEAAMALQRALALPGGPREAMLQLAALLHEGAGHLEPALAALDLALELAPTRAALHHNRAVLLQRLHRSVESLTAHEQAQALGAVGADVHYNHGNTLQSLGRGEEALSAYRRALQADARHGLALYDLARLRWRLGDDDFDSELRHLEAADTASSLGPGLRAHLLARAERPAEAAAAFAEALRREPAAAGFHDGLGRMLSRQGRHDEALAAHERAVALAPRDGDLHAHHAAALLAAGRVEEALAAAERACTLNPQDQHAWAQRGLAWRLLGDPRAQWLHDAERLVGVQDLEPPAGHADMASFNEALAVELRALHHDRRGPVDQTLRHGTQTLGNLLDQGHPLVDALKVRIEAAVTRYIAGLPAGDSLHPLIGRTAATSATAAVMAAGGSAGSGWRFTDSWSSRLGRGGFHTHHVHPHGWISSAYYVTLPPSVLGRSAGVGEPGEQASPGAHAGWIQFGEPDRDLGLPPLRRVQPQVGRLVLFPSYLWHGTLPFDDEAERLTIAFDVVPAG
ncbi:MAG: tetratricopeptide repeat protein [Rubrivivax sp.]|nr:tetratricopeptide repeat protein [Rubrivivax sp.]